MLTLNDLKNAVDTFVEAGHGELPVEVYFDAQHHALLEKVMTIKPSIPDFPNGTLLLKSE